MGEYKYADTLYEADDWKNKDEAYDYWDQCYGEGYYDYEVYVLLNMLMPGKYIYGPLVFDHEPFYVGHGKRGRARRSCYMDWLDIVNPKNLKEAKFSEIMGKGGSIGASILGIFKTKNKAIVEEKKIMNIIPRPPLCNSIIHYCDIPLHKDDYRFNSHCVQIP